MNLCQENSSRLHLITFPRSELDKAIYFLMGNFQLRLSRFFICLSNQIKEFSARNLLYCINVLIKLDLKKAFECLMNICYRVCNNPAPSLNGDYCFGDGEETTPCVSICKGKKSITVYFMFVL